MCQFLPSEVARLVLGYLEDTKCHKSYRAFLYECPDLEECRKVVSSGAKYRRVRETLLTILQHYCDLTSTDDVEYNSRSIPERPVDSVHSVFKSPDKNNCCTLRSHTQRQRNLTRQFLSVTRKHHNLNSSEVDDSLENTFNSDPMPSSNSQTPDTSTQSLKSAETMGYSVSSSEESHSNEQIVSSSTKQFFFDTENRKDTIKSVFLHNLVQKDISNNETIDVSYRQLNSAPSDQTEEFSYGSCSHTSSNRTMPVSQKQTLVQDNTFAINKTPLKDGANTSPCLITSNKRSEEVDRCETVKEKEIVCVCVQNSKQISDPELPHNTSSMYTQTANDSSSCKNTQVQTTGISSTMPDCYSPRDGNVTARSIISSAIVSKNTLPPTTHVASIPEYNSRPPTCSSSVKSPQCDLSNECLPQVPIFSSMKNGLQYADGKLQKRKDIIPCNLSIKSEPLSPEPEQHNLSIDNDTGSLGKSDKLIYEIIKHTNDTFEEQVASLSGKSEYNSQGQDSVPDSFANNLLPLPNNIALYKQLDDTQRYEMRTDHMAPNLNEVYNEKISISKQKLLHDLCENSVTKAPVIKTTIVEMPGLEIPVIKTEAVPENMSLNKSIYSNDLSEMSQKSDHQSYNLEAPSIHDEMLLSDASCISFDDTIIKTDDSDLIKNEINISEPNDSSPVPMDLTLNSTETSSLQVPSKGNLQTKGMPQRGEAGRQVAVQTSGGLNQEVIETVNYESSSGKEDSIQTMPISISQPPYVFSNNSNLVQNNAASLMYPFPNTNTALPGMQNNPQVYIILYPNPVPTGGNPSVPIPPIIQQIPSTSSNTTNQIVPLTPSNSSVTRRRTIRRSLRKNLFDPPTPSSNLSLHTKTTQSDLIKSKFIQSNSLKVPNLMIQDGLPNKQLNDSDHNPVSSITSIVSPLHYENNSSFLCAASPNAQIPGTVYLSQPPLSKITQGATCPIQMDNQVTSSVNASSTPMTDDISMENPPVKPTLPSGHLQGPNHVYPGSSRLPVILPKVPGLDLSNQDQRILRKRRFKSTTTGSKVKRGRPAAKPRLKKKCLFNSVHVKKSPMKVDEMSLQPESPVPHKTILCKLRQKIRSRRKVKKPLQLMRT